MGKIAINKFTTHTGATLHTASVDYGSDYTLAYDVAFGDRRPCDKVTKHKHAADGSDFYAPYYISDWGTHNHSLGDVVLIYSGDVIIPDRQCAVRRSDGSFYVVFYGRDGTIRKIYLSTSNDGGQTWSTEEVPTGADSANRHYQPVIVVDSSDNLHIVFRGTIDQATDTHHWSHIIKSSGDEWSEPVTIFQVSSNSISFNLAANSHNLAISSDDTITLSLKYRLSSVDYFLMYEYSGTWSLVDSPTFPEGGAIYQHQVLYNSTGTLFLFYTTYIESTYKLYEQERIDGSWTEPYLVAGGSGVAVWQIDARCDQSNNLHIAYYWNNSGVGTYGNKYISWTYGGVITEEDISSYSDDNFGGTATLAIGDSGCVISGFTWYTNLGEYSMYYIMHNIRSGAGSWSAEQRVYPSVDDYGNQADYIVRTSHYHIPDNEIDGTRLFIFSDYANDNLYCAIMNVGV